MIIVTPQGTTVDGGGTSVAPQYSYLVTLTGTDGTVWDLNNGPVQLMPGVKLFDAAPITPTLRRSALIPGARWTGVQVEEQGLLLPINVVGSDWRSYRDLEQAFFAGLAPDAPVVIAVTSPDGVSRTMECYFTTPGDITDDIDPLLVWYRSYQIGFVAPDPYWHGEVVRQPLDVQDPLPFFPGPPFHINPRKVGAKSSINNPGDVPSWPRYTIAGPAASWTVGVGDAVVSASNALAATDYIAIDSAPGKRSIVDAAGNRQYQNMDAVFFAPVPAGRQVPITTAFSGAASTSGITVELTPLYRRPL